MADQQDQSSLGGSVEKTSASADASKLRGKSGSTAGYRKRQSSANTVVATFSEKRRKQTDTTQATTQATQVCAIPVHRRAIDSSTKGEGKSKGERKNHGGGVGSLSGMTHKDF